MAGLLIGVEMAGARLPENAIPKPIRYLFPLAAERRTLGQLTSSGFLF
jgi:hypothetical protein